MHIVRSRGLKGDHGTWDEFMKSKFPRREDRFLTPVRRSKEDLIAFFLTLQKKDDLQVKIKHTTLLLHLYICIVCLAKISQLYTSILSCGRSSLNWDSVSFFLTLFQLLQAWVLNPSRFLARLLSKPSDHDDIPDSVLFMKRPIEFSDYSVYSRWHTLVQTTLAREDHPLDYFLSPPFEVCVS